MKKWQKKPKKNIEKNYKFGLEENHGNKYWNSFLFWRGKSYKKKFTEKKSKFYLWESHMKKNQRKVFFVDKMSQGKIIEKVKSFAEKKSQQKCSEKL